MVWVIGLNRTGTTSVAAALHVLGYPNLHHPDPVAMQRGDWTVFKGWRGGSDLPVAAWYRRLDDLFPGSKFVLTTRDPDLWLKSVAGHIERIPKADDLSPAAWARKSLYGSLRPSRAQLADAFARHEEDVRRHFEGRENDLLLADFTAGAGWAPLCRFLSVPEPVATFPKMNTADGKVEGVVEEMLARHRAYRVLIREYHKRLGGGYAATG